MSTGRRPVAVILGPLAVEGLVRVADAWDDAEVEAVGEGTIQIGRDHDLNKWFMNIGGSFLVTVPQ